MSLSNQPESSVKVLPSVVAGALLIAAGAAAVFLGGGPGWGQIAALVVCAALGAVAIIVPLTRADRRAAEARRVREDRIAALAEGVDAALARLHAATADLQLVAEQNHRQKAIAEEVEQKLKSSVEVAVTRFEDEAGRVSGRVLADINAAVAPAAEDVRRHLREELAKLESAAVQNLRGEAERLGTALVECTATAGQALAELPARLKNIEAARADMARELEAAQESVKQARVMSGEIARTTIDQVRAETDVAGASVREAVTALSAARGEVESALVEFETRLQSAREAAEVVATAPASQPVAAKRPKVAQTQSPQCEQLELSPEPVVEQPVEQPQAGSKSVSKVNPVQFDAKRAYTDLASAMDTALSS